MYLFPGIYLNLSSRRNIRFIYDYRVCKGVYLTLSLSFIVRDIFLSPINLRFWQAINYIIKHSEKKLWVGVTTRTHHTTPSYTRHIAIFAVLDCFWHVWRPVAQPHNYFLRKLFYQSKGKTFPVILHLLSICYLNAFKSNVKKTVISDVPKPKNRHFRY